MASNPPPLRLFTDISPLLLDLLEQLSATGQRPGEALQVPDTTAANWLLHASNIWVSSNYLTTSTGSSDGFDITAIGHTPSCLGYSRPHFVQHLGNDII